MDICFFCLLFSSFHFFYYSKVFLNLLLIFELMSFCLFLASMGMGGISLMGGTFYFCLLILVLGVCESVIGLGVLVSCSRFYGKFMVKSFSFLGV